MWCSLPHCRSYTQRYGLWKNEAELEEENRQSDSGADDAASSLEAQNSTGAADEEAGNGGEAVEDTEHTDPLTGDDPKLSKR